MLLTQDLPSVADTRAGQQKVTGEGIQGSLRLTRVSTPIGRVSVTEEMVTEFMSQRVASAPRFDIAINDSDPQAVNLSISAVGGCLP